MSWALGNFLLKAGAEMKSISEFYCHETKLGTRKIAIRKHTPFQGCEKFRGFYEKMGFKELRTHVNLTT